MNDNDIPVSMITRLLPRYAEPHRHYHTWAHIASCFKMLEEISDDDSLEVALALFYHDAVYEPLAKDNEERSAALLMEEGRLHDIDKVVLKKAASMILATKHINPPDSLQACVVCDVDLSIFGAKEDLFDEYERDIRKEYFMVPDNLFASGRKKVMQAFLERGQIFETKRGRQLWEEQAHKNLERSVKKVSWAS